MPDDNHSLVNRVFIQGRILGFIASSFGILFSWRALQPTYYLTTMYVHDAEVLGNRTCFRTPGSSAGADFLAPLCCCLSLPMYLRQVVR